MSNIVNRTSKASTSSSAEVNAKKFKLAAATSSKPGAGSRKSKKSIESASSLPNSQDAKIKIPEPDLDESEYESAEENLAEDTIVRHRYEPPARPVPPPGVTDFDLENWTDPNQCSVYAMDIFNYYKIREV